MWETYTNSAAKQIKIEELLIHVRCSFVCVVPWATILTPGLAHNMCHLGQCILCFLSPPPCSVMPLGPHSEAGSVALITATLCSRQRGFSVSLPASTFMLMLPANCELSLLLFPLWIPLSETCSLLDPLPGKILKKLLLWWHFSVNSNLASSLLTGDYT